MGGKLLILAALVSEENKFLGQVLTVPSELLIKPKRCNE